MLECSSDCSDFAAEIGVEVIESSKLANQTNNKAICMNFNCTKTYVILFYSAENYSSYHRIQSAQYDRT